MSKPAPINAANSANSEEHRLVSLIMTNIMWSNFSQLWWIQLICYIIINKEYSIWTQVHVYQSTKNVHMYNFHNSHPAVPPVCPYARVAASVFFPPPCRSLYRRTRLQDVGRWIQGCSPRQENHNPYNCNQKWVNTEMVDGRFDVGNHSHWLMTEATLYAIDVPMVSVDLSHNVSRDFINSFKHTIAIARRCKPLGGKRSVVSGWYCTLLSECST